MMSSVLVGWKMWSGGSVWKTGGKFGNSTGDLDDGHVLLR